jgi:hypothetical protein
MHMQNPVLAEVIAQVLACCHDARELAAIDHRRIGKPSLRPIDLHRSTGKRRRVPLGPSMYLVSFRHGSRSPLPQTQAMATALVNHQNNRRHCLLLNLKLPLY